jgi:3-methyladenine DNA glycosylase AlkD
MTSAGARIRSLDAALRRAGDPKRAVDEKRYLKSPIDHYGATVPSIRKAVAEFLDVQGPLPRRTLLAVVRRLWASRVHEQRMAAVLILEAEKDTLEPDDMRLLERMICGSFTWAYVDNLAASVAGSLVERYPELVGDLDRWAEDDSFWLRRSAMLALLGPLRRGEGDWTRFACYADAMLDEKEFFIRKAIGWVLRETSKKRPELVRRYVAARLDRLSGVTFREAVKRLPERDRERLVAHYRSS